MEAAPATAPTEATTPAKADAARAPFNSFARFMSFLHKLIDYGERLTIAFPRAGHIVDHADRFLHFGTTDLALILARIKRGLLRAQVLQASLQSDPSQIKDRLYLYPAPRESGSHKPGPRPAPRHTRAEREEAENAALLARLPTAAEIAEQIRDRTPGAVLMDIARDLGIIPGHPLYMELTCLAHVHAGSTLPTTQVFGYRLRNRHCYTNPDPDADAEPAPPPQPPPQPAIAATGPPG